MADRTVERVAAFIYGVVCYFVFFAAVTTLYILAAIRLEERDLVGLHGEEYRRYQKRVPMILPLRPGRAAVETSAEG